MNKYKYLLKNVGLLTISSFGSKLLGFLLIPLYTSVLSTQDYGSYDLLYTTISLLIPILTLNIVESTLRFSLDKKYDKSIILTVSNKIIFRGIIVFLLLCLFNYIFDFFEVINIYILYFILFFIISIIFQLLQYFARGTEKIFDLAVSGIINSIIMLVLNIYFLVYLKLGINGYFLANIISHFFASLYLFFRIPYFKYIKHSKSDINLENEMINYSKPLVLNSIGWWINNASDRYIVTWLCGLSANGIYSVAYKIPSILSIIQTIFNQAWQLSTVKSYDYEDKDNFFKNIYKSYNIIMILSCSIMIIFTKVFAKLLYANNFYEAWRYVPFLMISIVFGALSGVIGGVFQAVKDSKILSYTTLIGAVLNLIMNIIFVYLWGTIGAAIATAISYFFVWQVRYLAVKKYIKLKNNVRRDIISYLFLCLQTIVVLFIKNAIIMYSVQVVIFITIIALYFSDFIILFGALKRRFSK